MPTLTPFLMFENGLEEAVAFHSLEKAHLGN